MMATAAGGTHPTGMHSCIELCGRVHTAQRQRPMQISILCNSEFVQCEHALHSIM